MKQKGYLLKIWRLLVAGLLALFLSFISIELKTHNHFDVSSKKSSEYSNKKDLNEDKTNCFVCLFNLNNTLNLSFQSISIYLDFIKKQVQTQIDISIIQSFIITLPSRAPPVV